MTDPVQAPGEPAAGPAPAQEEGDSTQRLVAVLIMVVTLVGAVFAYLQTDVGNREGTATRRAQIESVRAMALQGEGGRTINRRDVAWDTSTDHGWLRSYYDDWAGAGGAGAAFARAMARAHEMAEREAGRYSEELARGDFELPDGTFDYTRFYEEQYVASYRAAELEAALGRERDAWSQKGSEFVTVITVMAVALFLLGLTLTVPPTARRPFLAVGSVVALAASVWGGTVWMRPVEPPSEKAIDAFTNAHLELATADGAADHERAIELFTEAIEARPEYTDAYLGRGGAHFRLDFLHPDGPQGSSQALADWQRARELGEDGAVIWTNLGAVQWWLGEYDAALESTKAALDLDPDDLTINLNYAEALLATGREAPFRERLDRIRELLGAAPSWLRDSQLEQFYRAAELAIRHRPELADEEREMLETIKRMHHEIGASMRIHGSPTPPEIDATLSELEFTLSQDRRTLEIRFDYEGVDAGQEWFYDTYVNGTRERRLSFEQTVWDFAVPDGSLVLTLTEPGGFTSGNVVRTEVFIEANLLAAGEFAIP